jgi:hypothetical protein
MVSKKETSHKAWLKGYWEWKKEKELLDLSYKQSKANKQERLDNEKKTKNK